MVWFLLFPLGQAEHGEMPEGIEKAQLNYFGTPLLKPSEWRSRSPGPKGRERDLVRPGQGHGWPLRGPTEASFKRGDPAPVFQMRGTEPGGPSLSVPFLGYAKKETRRTGAGPR